MGKFLSWLSFKLPLKETAGVGNASLTQIAYHVREEGLDIKLEINFRFGNCLFPTKINVLYPSANLWEMEHYIPEPIQKPPNMWEEWEDTRAYITGYIENLHPYEFHKVVKIAFNEMLGDYFEVDEYLEPFKELFID